MIKTRLLPLRWIALYLLKTELQRLLLTSVGFGLLLLLARTVYTQHVTFTFLVWNLFLAFLPWLLSTILSVRPAGKINTWKLVVGFVTWLLFIPNSFYMLTDLFHLYDSTSVPRWYDLLMILSFAWNACLLGILSVRQMEKIVAARWRLYSPGWFIYPVMCLNAVGIYIGRYLRYNSWDIVSNPFQLFLDMIHLLIHPFSYRNAWAMIACFSFFLSILYATLKKLSAAV